MNVTFVLNGFRRPHTLERQYNAIKDQTYPVQEIMFWQNNSPESAHKFPKEVTERIIAASCNANLGVWARFAFALNATTKYVCVIDDDTIPGNEWIENCLTTIKTHCGLLGCRGVRMIGDDYKLYPGCKYESISGNNDEVERVDIMGHSWFFEKDWLRYYWLEMPEKNLLYGGEDMHFSYAIQRHLDLYTYVPPQPSDNKNMWGSLNPFEYGEDMVATSRTMSGHMQANSYWNHIIKQGYKLAKDKK